MQNIEDDRDCYKHSLDLIKIIIKHNNAKAKMMKNSNSEKEIVFHCYSNSVFMKDLSWDNRGFPKML